MKLVLFWWWFSNQVALGLLLGRLLVEVVCPAADRWINNWLAWKWSGTINDPRSIESRARLGKETDNLSPGGTS